MTNILFKKNLTINHVINRNFHSCTN